MENSMLVFPRKVWEEDYWEVMGKFTKKELDKAEKRKNGFIGFRSGIKCYIWKYLKEGKVETRRPLGI